MNTQARGAKIQAPSIKPSIDLSGLVTLLADAIEVEQAPTSSLKDPKRRPLFIFDEKKNRLRICTSGVLLRLFFSQNFTQGLRATESSGFVRDFQSPAFGLRAKLGGELTESTVAGLPANVDKLIAAIDQALDDALPSSADLSKLLLDKPAEQLKHLAAAAAATFKDQPHQASLQPLAFDSAPSGTSGSTTAVAKVLAAVEQVEAEDYFEQLLTAVETQLQNRGCDEDEIEDALDSLEAERDRADSQITRFLSFLDDEALSRVRLNVTCRIMEAIADHARSSTQAKQKLLAEYVDRVLALIEAAKGSGLTVDLTSHYGQDAEFNLLDYLSQATFFTCLSVWPEWKTQIFEEKVRSQSSYGVQREVSYRFRINGINPEHNKPAFECRLDLIEGSLVQGDEPSFFSGSLRRRLAELIVLDTVIPLKGSNGASISSDQILSEVQSRLNALSNQGEAVVQEVLLSLKARAGSMQDIADALVEIIKSKGTRIVAQAQRRTAQQFICVKRGVVAWSRLEGAEAGVRDLLVSTPSRSQEKVEWFGHIEISDTPDVPQLLFSVKVTTELTEHALVLKEKKVQSIQAQRVFLGQLLQVIWVPFNSAKDAAYEVNESAKALRSWALPAAVQVEYEVRTLSRNPKKNDDSSKQLHAAGTTAFVILVYCCLWRIVKRLKSLQPESTPEFTTLMLRCQEAGKNSISEGDTYVYAAAQSVEAMLAQDAPTRMQGIVLNKLTSNNRSAQYVKTGTFDAFISAFPLVIGTHHAPAVKKIGLISYATRPSDEVPHLEQDDGNHLFITQSYTASAVNQPFPGYKLKLERIQSDIVTTSEDLRKQRLVQEEISHLKKQGCQHIILLSHAYGSRHINRTSDNNIILTPTTFLEEVFQSFPDLTIYHLLRDIFPATRLRKRETGEAAFEILSAADHVNFLRNSSMERVRDIIPVYTFATLHVIEEEKRPQSGFCVYFLVSDQRVSNIAWTERARQHLLDPEENSPIHPCLISVLRGLHFIEAERGVKGGQLLPVLDPFSWIAPSTKEAAGEVEILHSRRRGRVHLSYPALLTHVSQVLHRR